MTTTTKPTRRETLSSIRERGKLRPIIVELASTYVKLRLKGMRYTFTVTYGQLFLMGAKNAAEARRQERETTRKAKKLNRC
jgi:hypothetical protein